MTRIDNPAGWSKNDIVAGGVFCWPAARDRFRLSASRVATFITARRSGARLENHVERSLRGFMYARETTVADDMTFSAPRTGYLTGVVSQVAKIIRSLASPNLEINGKKTVYVTKKYHRSVTGLTLANDGRVTIGRDRKRKIRAIVHRATLGALKFEEIQVLAGTLAYVNAVEPDFLTVLIIKYGADKIESIQRMGRGKKLSWHEPPIANFNPSPKPRAN